MEKLKFLTPKIAEQVCARFGTPVFVYDERTLKAQAAKALAFPNAFGLTVRYAMKASSNAAILRIFDGCGLHLDASSGWECERAIRAGIDATHISLSTQELPARDQLVRLRVPRHRGQRKQPEREAKHSSRRETAEEGRTHVVSKSQKLSRPRSRDKTKDPLPDCLLCC